MKRRPQGRYWPLLVAGRVGHAGHGQARATRESVWAQDVDAGTLVIGTQFATRTTARMKHLPQGGFWVNVTAV